MKQRWLLGFFLFGSLISVSCGGAEVKLDRTGVDTSIVQLEVPGSGEDASTNEARLFFTNNLSSLVVQENAMNWDQDPSIKGCIDAGCHVRDESEPLFFQLRPQDPNFNWNYLGSRRFEFLIRLYADELAETLEGINKNEAGEIELHFSFNNWSTTELCLLQEWTYLQTGVDAPEPCEFQ